jgi:outer membrane protein OmpA-like peptidoglycan-associated protein
MKINMTKTGRKARAAWTVLPAFLLFGGSAVYGAYGAPQEQQQGVVVEHDANGNPIYKVTVVEHTTRAINYQHRSGSTEVDFRGTDLMPQARGEVNVNSKQGRIEIKMHVEKMNSPGQYGPEYLTYVLWAVTPEGRPKNLGEVLLSGGNDHSSMEVTTDLQTFGLIITAEPYFAVTQPSNVVVMENVISDKTVGTIEPINVHYELLERGQYVLNVDRSLITPYDMDRKTPLELYEARNAVRIAKWTGADQWALDAFQRAKISLQNAEDEYLGRSTNKKTIQQNSRDAAQTAEDARLITVRKIEDKQTADAQAAAQAREADAAAQAAEADRQRAAADQQRLAAEQAKAQSDADAQRALEQQRAAEAASVAAAQQAQAQAAQAEAEKARLREQLREQLNQVLETRESAGRLIVNMSDVLFDFGQFTLKPGAKEKLAKISGILISHPGLTLEVDGHTDSVGSDAVNLTLSERRADTVRAYLVAQGVAPDTISAHGFGKEQPVATNDTASGRQLNRRVEIVVAGSSIASNQ